MNPVKSAVLARNPLIYITSPEEERVIAEIENIILETEQRLWAYSATKGLWRISVENKKNKTFSHESANNALRDPIALLSYITTLHLPSVGAIFLLLDFHEWLRDAMVRRHLREMIPPLKESGSSFIIIAPVRQQIPELEHDIWQVDFPRPSFQDIAMHLESPRMSFGRLKVNQWLYNSYQKEKVAEAGSGLTFHQFEQCLSTALLYAEATGDRSNIVDALLEGKKQLIRQSGLLEVMDKGSPHDVGGLSNVKEWFEKRRHGFSKQAQAAGLPQPKGILLLGVPGSGKSLTARALSGLWSFPLLRLDTGNIFVSQVGGSEERARQAILTAEAAAPCVLWIDELDKALAGLGSSADSDAGTAARVFATLATWMQEKTAPVFIIATANSVAALPPELLRKGRWDDVFFVDLPGLGERVEIIGIHLQKRGYHPQKFNVRLLAEHSQGYSGAEIEQAIIAGLYDAFNENRKMTTDDVLTGLKDQVPLSVTMKEEVSALRQWAAARARPASHDKLEAQRDQWLDKAVPLKKKQNTIFLKPNNRKEKKKEEVNDRQRTD